MKFLLRYYIARFSVALFTGTLMVLSPVIVRAEQPAVSLTDTPVTVNLIQDSTMDAPGTAYWQPVNTPRKLIKEIHGGSRMLRIDAGCPAGAMQPVVGLERGHSYELRGTYEFIPRTFTTSGCASVATGPSAVSLSLQAGGIKTFASTFVWNKDTGLGKLTLALGNGTLYLDNISIIDVTPAPVVPPAPVPAPAPVVISSNENDRDRYRSVVALDYAAFPEDTDANVGGNTLYVATTGSVSGDGSSNNPLSSIYTAVTRAEAGDTIVVRGGNYTDCGGDNACYGLDITKAGLRITTRGEVVNMTPSGRSNYGFVIGANDVVIDGINIAGFQNNGVNLGNNTRGTVVKNLTISGGSSDGIAAYGTQNGLLLKNVRILDSDVQGLTCGTGPCNNWRLDYVTVRNASGGVGSGADAIAMENGSNVLITNSDVSGASADGIDLKVTRAAVFNSKIHDVGRNGVKFWKGGDLVNSIVTRTGADTSVSFPGIGATLQENTYRILNSIVGLHNDRNPELNAYSLTVAYDHPQNPVQVEITNSVFYRNTNGIYFSPGTRVTLKNNLLQAGYNNNRVMDVTTLGVQKAIVGSDNVSVINDGVVGSGNLPFVSDPGFAAPRATDYSFGAGSVLVSKGLMQSGFPEFDLKSGARTLGTAPDIGPLELF